MIRKISNVLFAAGLLVLSACAPVTAPAAETAAPTEQPAPTPTLAPIHIKVGILNYMSNSPLFIAQEEGYFAEQGLEVELISFGFDDSDLIPALLQGQLDVGTVSLNAATMNAIAQGSNSRFVADKSFINPEAACASEGWVASTALLEAGTLDDLAGLRGLTTSVDTGNSFEYVVDLLLEEAGLTRDDLEIVEVKDQVARIDALGNGALDLYVVNEPWITRARKAGAGDLWQPLSRVIQNLSVAAILYSPSMLERDSQVGVAFMTAYLKGIEQFSQGKTDRNLEIITGYLKSSPEELREVCWPSFQPDGRIDLAGLTGFVQWAFEKGYLDSPLSIEQIWDPQFVDQANKNLNR